MLKDDAHHLIKQRLFELDLLSGQFVTQRQISELIGIPIGPVREAMHRLATEGLVEILPQRGIQITPVSEEMVRDLYGLRRLLEAPGMKILAEEGEMAELRGLKRATEDTLEMERHGEINRLSGITFDVDQQLHLLAIAALDNQVVSQIYRTQQDRLRLIRLNIRASTDHEPWLSDHVSILDALCCRDAGAAVERLLVHLNNAEQSALEALARSPPINGIATRARSTRTRSVLTS